MPTTYDKEFAFTRLITCGHCTSGITAFEKFKPLKDGGTNRYVYYGCTKSKDHYCKAGYLREEILTEQLLNIIEQLSLDELGLKEKIEHELDKHSKFRAGVLGIDKTEQIKLKSVDSKNYVKYILRDGTAYDKRDLLSCLKSKLILKDKKLTLV